MFDCAICNVSYEDFFGNNPEPLLESRHLICGDCYCYVTAVKLEVVSGKHLTQLELDLILRVLIRSRMFNEIRTHVMEANNNVS